MDKARLPPNWQSRVSKTYPDRIYYFNKETGECSWDLPKLNVNKDVQKSSQYETKKRKSLEESDRKQSKVNPTSPPLERPKLTAVRKLNNNNNNSNNNNNNERSNTKIIPTSVMKFYQDKIDRKSGKSESVKQKVVCLNDKPNNEKSKETEKSTKKQERPLITPSMRIAMLQKRPANEDPKNNKNQTDEPSNKNIKRISKAPISVPKADNESRINQSGKLKKNIASRRMKNLKQKLKVELLKEKEDVQMEMPVDSVSNDHGSSVNVRSVLRNLQPLVRRNVEEYLKSNLENSLQNEDIDIPRSVSKQCFESLVEEEMDWEPIGEERILTEVCEVRQKICSLENAQATLPQNEFQISSIQKTNNLYIIVDTNVFLIDLKRIEDILNAKFKVYGRPFIIVPWTVIQELDAIKDSKSKPENLKKKARKAISFLHNHFSNKHPRILGQTAEDAYSNKEKYNDDNPDDLIWQTCLQIQSHHPHVVLLTFDKNLQNKAIFNKIKVLGRDSTLDMIGNTVINSSTGNHFLSNNQTNTTDFDNISQREALFVEDIFSKSHEVLQNLMTEVLSNEAKQIFGERWKNHMKIKPPWTAITALKCAELHWIAITSEAFENRIVQRNIKKLQEILRKSIGELKMKDFSQFLDTLSEMVQMLNSEKYSTLQNQISQHIDQLRCTFIEHEQMFNDLKMEAHIGSIKNQQEVEERAKLVMTIFERVFVFFQNITGAFLTRFQFACPFFYEANQFREDCFRKEWHSEILNTLKAILHYLKASLNNVGQQQTNFSSILQLYDSLMSVPLDFGIEVSPLDVYCCLKHNEPQIRVGVTQFEDLLLHLSKIVNCSFT